MIQGQQTGTDIAGHLNRQIQGIDLRLILPDPFENGGQVIPGGQGVHGYALALNPAPGRELS